MHSITFLLCLPSLISQVARNQQRETWCWQALFGSSSKKPFKRNAARSVVGLRKHSEAGRGPTRVHEPSLVISRKDSAVVAHTEANNLPDTETRICDIRPTWRTKQHGSPRMRLQNRPIRNDVLGNFP